ncbi:MAG: tRNA lysidine(34) synthetase TilS [Bacteroidetes bacterium]|nr:tRNA lysidine(34) synthetase TilS [Bacteroidota bacterium]
MLERFRAYNEEHGLLSFGERVLLAVSGGVDSVVMAHLFAGSDYECAIAHCNFQLRGEDSDTDEVFVRSLAAQLEMPVYVERFDVDSEMEEKGISLQMAARDLRYDWFSSLAKHHSLDAIATAHNLNDSVETFFLNLSRGTGIRGLTGIPNRNDQVIRPILFASRKEIEKYARKHRLAFREDRSNRETKYQRNKIRHDVIPSMEQINPGFIDTMALNMERMLELREIVEGSVDTVRNEIFKGNSGEIHIKTGLLMKLDPMGTWLYELFAPYGFTRLQCREIEQFLKARPGKRFLSPSHQLFKDRDQLILVESRSDSFERYYLDTPEKHSSLPFSMDVEVMERDKLGQIPTDRNTACLDYDEIQFPLTIRRWLPGDYFYPLGMDQIKKLSDFFVDEKVPVPVKERTWILTNGKKIAWIMGHRIDNRFRITEHTSRVLLLRLQSDIVP